MVFLDWTPPAFCMVVATDVLGSNGVVHIIDTVLANPSPLPTIVEAAIDAPFLSTLVTAVQKAGWVDTLNGDGTFTVFAPNNAAFDKVPADALNELLKEENVNELKETLLRHVVGSVIKAKDIPEGSTDLKTVGGEKIRVIKSDAGVTIESSSGKANVIATDVLGSNGVVHVIDKVLTNLSPLSTIAEAAIDRPFLSTLVSTLQKAGLVDTLSGEGTFTVFAPNNEAFGKVPAEALGGLLEDKEALTAVLLRHVLPVSVKAGDIPAGSTVLKTVGGEEITVTNADGAVTIESNGVIATVIATDVLASNGVVHVIDTVLAAAPAAEPATEEVELPSIAAAAIATPSLSTLVTAVKAAGLVETLSGEGTFTVFAPTNDAFAKIPAETLGGLLEDKTALTAVLARHVIAGAEIMAGDIGLGVTKVETLGGVEVEVIRAGSCVALRSSAGVASVVTADVVATNGVIH